MRKFVLLNRHCPVLDKDGNPIEMIIDDNDNKSRAEKITAFYDLLENHYGIPIYSIPCDGDLQVSFEDDSVDVTRNFTDTPEGRALKEWYLSMRGELK